MPRNRTNRINYSFMHNSYMNLIISITTSCSFVVVSEYDDVPQEEEKNVLQEEEKNLLRVILH